MSLTATIAASDVQNAAFDLLAANAAFFTTALGERFYTDVPQGTVFPQAWLTFEGDLESPNGTFGRCGAIVHLTLHIYSTYEGDAEALGIMKQATEIFNAGLSVSGWSTPWINRSMTPTWAVEDFNGIALRHGRKPFDVYVLAN